MYILAFTMLYVPSSLEMVLPDQPLDRSEEQGVICVQLMSQAGSLGSVHTLS